MRIAILGAGAWGTALAINAAGQSGGRREVTLWARDVSQAQAMAEQRAKLFAAQLLADANTVLRADHAG